ncbi:MAG: precorrin-2 C(20)-methyltransferase [Oscillatoriales cyanobacterium]|nr:MAG: precorrin-2 C(20)-methyltransferase [Oscillatoriales cyanobacterium]
MSDRPALDQPSTGKLYGIGVGPGDPELLTLKAHRLLTAASVVAYPAAADGESVARAIVADFLRPEQLEVPIILPFSPRQSAQPSYDRGAAEIASHLQGGRDVVVLCEGEPMLYGSFMYLLDRLADRFPTEVVPGISSTLAAAAVAGLPLTYRQDVLTIAPATLDRSTLRDRLAHSDAAVIIKLGRHFAKVRSILTELGLLERARYVERATLPTQQIRPIGAIDPAHVPYWSLIVIPSANNPRDRQEA